MNNLKPFQGVIQDMWAFLKRGLRKAFTILFVIMLVVAFLPLAMVVGGMLLVLVLLCTLLVIVGFFLGISGMFWALHGLSSGSERILPWI